MMVPVNLRGTDRHGRTGEPHFLGSRSPFHWIFATLANCSLPFARERIFSSACMPPNWLVWLVA